ncbi:protein FAM3C-like isoform X2 [Nelusetta ayraudi]|uniref:protein FAM3C-like isoform X2 n=1 Tax=Nelusetta ayraudi TaxID=303726 RepID=UPI003F71113E
MARDRTRTPHHQDSHLELAGKVKMARRQTYTFFFQVIFVLVALVLLISFVLQRSNQQLEGEWPRIIAEEFFRLSMEKGSPRRTATPCSLVQCPRNERSFFIQSGAANAVGPKICINDKLVLGTVKNNAGIGINVVVVNGQTYEVMRTNHFNMFDGEVAPFIKFLNGLESGAFVLIASFDEPGTKLNDEARKLITELGSTYIRSVGFRDSWVFLGRKGATSSSRFEKYVKNDKETNKYDHWPELLSLEGCLSPTTV